MSSCFVDKVFRARYSPPCITARRGGCVIKKNVAQRPKRTQPGWFSFCIHRKTTPASRSAEASRYLLDRSATPPCGDARRGMACLETWAPFFSQLPRLRRFGGSATFSDCAATPPLGGGEY